MHTFGIEDQRTAHFPDDVCFAWFTIADPKVEQRDNLGLCAKVREADQPLDAAIKSSEDKPARATEGPTTKEIAEAILALPGKERVILALYIFEELTLQEIGTVLHLADFNVAEIVASALSQLGVLLKAQPV